ncbi:MAG: VOC family protein [Bdellovibrionales bacterium]|nr:VOC family protein [Bdellovibrionales bacterium]
MSTDPKHHEKINYVELPCADLEKTKQFFSTVFSWTFVNYGPDYTAFSDQGLDGGFFRSDLQSTSQHGSALLVFYSRDLEQTQSKIKTAGGKILKEIFSFPGGQRFHFTDPHGNEYAVWSDL